MCTLRGVMKVQKRVCMMKAKMRLYLLIFKGIFLLLTSPLYADCNIVCGMFIKKEDDWKQLGVLKSGCVKWRWSKADCEICKGHSLNEYTNLCNNGSQYGSQCQGQCTAVIQESRKSKKPSL